MGRKIEYVGKKFGKLTVLKEVEESSNHRMFLCKCECGNEKIIRGAHLSSGETKSCGCLLRKDITGQKFGMLTAIEPILEKPKNRQYKWKCICDCGNIVNVDIGSLTSGNTKSCGKHFKPKGKLNGLSNSRIYMIHAYMKNRCNCPENTGYPNYGGRGIKVCEEWDNPENGFMNFYKWSMENGYSDDLSIDRIDVNGNYCPQNCRWADMTTQARNQRVRSTNRSGVTGITVSNEKGRRKKYRATFQLGEKRIVIGSFEKLEDAIEARRQAELKYWGYTKIPKETAGGK